MAELPSGAQWRYEPKWDGFRCLAFRDGDEVELRSKSGQPLGRYFPDVAAALAALPARRFALDGEIVIPVERRLSFEALQLRLHPAESRVRKLVAEHPAVFVVVRSARRARRLRAAGTAVRRAAARAGRVYRGAGRQRAGLRLSPSTADRDAALGWLGRLGADIDGIIAKRADLPYLSGRRDGMRKYKQQQTADCVVGGLSLRPEHQAGRLAAARPLRRGRPVAPCRLHRDIAGARQAGADRPPRTTRRAAGLHRPRSRRPEPLVNRALRRLAAAAPRAGRGGALRPRDRQPFPARHDVAALAAGQGAATMHRSISSPRAATAPSLCSRLSYWSNHASSSRQLLKMLLTLVVTFLT